ncbi:glutamate racemase [Gemella parahaemolysans]
MKIAVMAGTPIDSKLGAELLNSYGYDDVVLVPISNNPVEQTMFQALEDEERENIIVKIIEELKEKNYEAIFVYCNSLSSVVDFDRLAEKMNISIITPMQMYRNLGLEYKYLAVMAANSHGLTGVENNLYVSNPRLCVLGLSMLELVKAIEEGNKPEQIVEDFNFKTLFNYFEQTKVEAVVLGCTHFPYIKKELEKITKLPIIDVGVFMINSMEKR